ncbi:hypothetical protein BSR29_07385 [Boudabousia liubingyangii]|uniref:Uncharacterized protein n=1 Tax=Boudabousia liubingyangii TaxID=1921764 RepID=A0A1Q5PK77_9ACTO|nr:hypothetical protein BSR29_07385 [Boudabousia liubingyangii]
MGVRAKMMHALEARMYARGSTSGLADCSIPRRQKGATRPKTGGTLVSKSNYLEQPLRPGSG